MPPPTPFTLRIPTRRPVEVVIIELADGRIVARTADELTPSDAALEAAPRG